VPIFLCCMSVSGIERAARVPPVAGQCAAPRSASRKRAAIPSWRTTQKIRLADFLITNCELPTKGGQVHFELLLLLASSGLSMACFRHRCLGTSLDRSFGNEFTTNGRTANFYLWHMVR
jgi:hypothetical protein